MSTLARRLRHEALSRPSFLVRFAALTAMGQALRLLGPLVLQIAVDKALPHGALHMLHLIALAIVVLGVHRAWVEWLRQSLVRTFDVRVSASLLRGVFDHVLRLPLPILQKKSVGELVQCMASTEALAGITVSQVAAPVIEAIAACSSLALIAIRLPGLALALALLSVPLLAGAVWSGRAFAARQVDVLETSAKHRSLLYEMLEGATTIKTSAAGVRTVSKWLRLLAAYQTSLVRQLQVAVWLEVLMDGAAKVATVAVLLWGGERCLRGEISVGVLLATLMFAQAFLYSIMSLGHGSLPLWGAVRELQRVDAILAEGVSAPISTEPASTRGSAKASDVVLDDVWFRYGPSEPWILKGVSLRIDAGARHDVSGPSGKGKTTMLRLIAGLYAPERGRVTVGDVDATACASQGSAYLPQQLQLIEGTILENLTLLSQAPEARILEAAEATGLAKLVETFPMKYATRLPPGAPNLSGGQRQLIAFTACVASDRPVVLLDEAFSNMDALTRKHLRDADLLAGRTVIAVEHEARLRAATRSELTCQGRER